MKTRSGFVSNSSSSSFMLCGNRIFTLSWYDLAEIMKSSLIVMRKANGGTSGSCEDFLVRMAPDYVDMFMKAYVNIFALEFFDISYMCDAFGNFSAAKDGYPEGYVASFRELKNLAKKNGDSAFEFEMDYNSPNPAKASESDYYRIVKWTGQMGDSIHEEMSKEEGLNKVNNGKWLEENGFSIGSGGQFHQCYVKIGTNYEIRMRHLYNEQDSLPWECTVFLDDCNEEEWIGRGSDAKSAYDGILKSLEERENRLTSILKSLKK